MKKEEQRSALDLPVKLPFQNDSPRLGVDEILSVHSDEETNDENGVDDVSNLSHRNVNGDDDYDDVENARLRVVSSSLRDYESLTSFPSHLTAHEAYSGVTCYISKKEFQAKKMMFVSGCAVLAAIAGYYNYAFGKAYVYDVSMRWGFNEFEADVFSSVCGSIGLVINTAINGQSIHQFYYVLKDEIIKKTLNKDSMPDDNIRRITLSIMSILSLIGALPNLKFVYDTSNDGSVFYLIFMEVIQFFTMTALNMRGLYNTIKIDSEKKHVVQKFKLQMLVALNQCLRGSLLGDEDLTALSQGILVRKRFPVLRQALKLGTGLYVGGYSAAFYFAVKNAIDMPETNTFIDDLMNFGVTACGLLSAALKWFLLGNAYAGLVDRIFNLFQEPILKINQNEVRSQYISRNVDRTLAIGGLLIALLSLGSASKIVERYFFGSQEKTAETFFLSLLIGGGPALGINAMDLSTMIERLIDFVATIFQTKIRASSNRNSHLGNTHNEMVMRAMLEIVTMSDSTFIDKFLTEFNSEKDNSEESNVRARLELCHISSSDSSSMSLDETEGFNAFIHTKREDVYMHGYAAKEDFHTFFKRCGRLQTCGDNMTFQTFKNSDTESEVDNGLREIVARRN